MEEVAAARPDPDAAEVPGAEIFMVVAIIYLVMTTCWDFVAPHRGLLRQGHGAAADRQLARRPLRARVPDFPG
jgi:hypothetical protein